MRNIYNNIGNSLYHDNMAIYKYYNVSFLPFLFPKILACARSMRRSIRGRDVSLHPLCAFLSCAFLIVLSTFLNARVATETYPRFSFGALVTQTPDLRFLRR